MGLNVHFIGLVLLPWISGLFLSVIPSRFSKTSSIFLAFISGVLAISFLSRVHGSDFSVAYTWFTMGQKSIQASFWMNTSAQVLVALVHLVAICVHIFSASYLAHEPKIRRYYTYLHLFLGAMTLLILTDQTWIFYGAWELVGACSYLLISFWYQKPEAIRAAKKAFLLNRLGDIGLLFGLIGLSVHYQTDQFSAMNIGLHGPAPFLIGFAILLGGIGKSAQFPLMSWLPDAMEGPTPASALIHAATMVAAGVYVGIRIYPLTSEEVHLAMGLIGAISFLAGGIFALFQSDIKKALAYSTISQLGLMWMGMGSEVSLMHLWTHGIFKAGLFLSAGYVIHALHSQDVNQMGGLRKSLPIPALTYAVFAAGMMGLPLTSGFYSKEFVAGHLLDSAANSSYALYYESLLVVLAAGMVLTAWYISRQFYLIFLGESRAEKPLESNSKLDFAMIIPMGILALGSFAFVLGNPVFSYFGLSSYEVPSSWLIWTGISWILGIGLTWFTRGWIPKGNVQFWAGWWPNAFQYVWMRSRQAHWIETHILDRSVNGIARFQVILAHLGAWVDHWVVDGILVGFTSGLSGVMGGLMGRWQSGKLASYWVLVFITFGLFLLFSLLI